MKRSLGPLLMVSPPSSPRKSPPNHPTFQALAFLFFASSRALPLGRYTFTEHAPEGKPPAAVVEDQHSTNKAKAYGLTNEIYNKYSSGEQHVLHKAQEILGEKAEQMKKAVKGLLQEKEKSFLSKVLDKVKGFLSRFIPLE